MKKLLFAAAALLTLCGCVSGPDRAASPVTITRESKYQIVLPDLPQKSAMLAHLTKAAKMIQSALKEGLGLEAPLVQEAKAASGVKAFYIGNTKAAQEAGIDVKKHPDFGFEILEKDGNIYIAGEDKTNFGQEEKRGMFWGYYILGTVNGCVKFAEKYLNTRFLYPGANGIDYAKLDKVTIPAGLHEVCKPAMIFASRSREMLYSYSNNAYGYGAFKSYGGHSYYDACPTKVYAQTHPEYFALLAGKRNPNGNHLCISNPAVQELIYKEMLKWLDQGAKVVQLAQTDGYQACQCENCKKLFGVTDEGEKLWILHRNLAERLLKERPGKFAHIICYGPTVRPPKTFKKFPPNVIIELCHYDKQSDFDRWIGYEVPGGFTTYIYNWGWYNRVGFLPKRTPGYCAEQVRVFLRNHVRGVYRCGFGENFGLEGPSYYVFGQMFNDANQAEERLVDDFLRRAFHESYAPMKIFYETLFDRLALYSALQDAKYPTAPGAAPGGSVMPQNPRVIITAILGTDTLDIMGKNLARAEKLATSPKVKARLELVRTEFEYVKNLASTLHLYNAYRINPTQESFDALAKMVEARNALLKSYEKPFNPKRPNDKGMKNYSKNWPDLPIFNNPPMNMLRENGRLSAPIGAPLNWNTKLLKEQKILPGVGKKTMHIPRASGPVSSTDFESGAWAKAKWQQINGIQLGAVKSKSRVKALYDAKNFYVAFEIDVDPRKTFTPCGHDGPCWGQDCVELMLDPTGTRNVYYHLIMNPVPNSSYDAAFGLITDVLDPRYNKDDRGWNGKWEYKATRKGDKCYVMVTVPFTTLNTAPATKGTIWAGNFGREAFFYPPVKVPELSLWSPNLETMSFHDREALGDWIFD